jgi:hypothetical protein
MSHYCHDEHSHSHGGGDEHDHSDDITPALQFSLYQHINFDEVTTLNEAVYGSGKAIVKKTWAERLQPEPEVQSDVDEQLLINIPYVFLSHLLTPDLLPLSTVIAVVFVGFFFLPFSCWCECMPVWPREGFTTSGVILTERGLMLQAPVPSSKVSFVKVISDANDTRVLLPT